MITKPREILEAAFSHGLWTIGFGTTGVWKVSDGNKEYEFTCGQGGKWYGHLAVEIGGAVFTEWAGEATTLQELVAKCPDSLTGTPEPEPEPEPREPVTGERVLKALRKQPGLLRDVVHAALLEAQKTDDIAIVLPWDGDPPYQRRVWKPHSKDPDLVSSVWQEARRWAWDVGFTEQGGDQVGTADTLHEAMADADAALRELCPEWVLL